METPLKIVFRNTERSEWLEQIIKEKAKKLNRLCKQIVGCNIIVDIPHKHHHQGNLYSIRINIVVPGKEIAINKESYLHTEAQDISTAVQDAFLAARRQLEDYIRCRRHQVKTHSSHINITKRLQQNPPELLDKK